tara:strand:- start:403 stop:555 length:153 start_codon:yes stop_codon:yes gene_type:complete
MRLAVFAERIQVPKTEAKTEAINEQSIKSSQQTQVSMIATGGRFQNAWQK